MHSFWAMARKESRHILRDWQTLGIIIALPVLMLLMFGFALSADLKEVPLRAEVPQLDAKALSLLHQIDGSSLFAVVEISAQYSSVDSSFRTPPRPRAILRFPTNFSACLQDKSCKVQVLIDGSDPNTAMLLAQALSPALSDAALKITGTARPELIQIQSRFLFNPEQKSSLYFVPGLMATLLMMVCALLTSVTLVREKENGTLEQLKMSPMKPAALILGKLSPYVLIAAVIATLILCLGYVAFGLVIQGSWAFLTLATLIYIFCALSLGLLISTVAHKQQHAMLLALGGTMLPSIILSGFVFPIASMPAFLQILSQVIPATWYLQMVRGIVLQGSGFQELWSMALVLLLMGTFLTLVATHKLRRQLK